MATEEPKTANDLAVTRTELATERTLMAANRTLMAWVRTAISLISFGFTIHKLLQSTAGQQIGLIKGDGGRRIGLFLIGLGALCVILGTVEFLQTTKRLDKGFVMSWRHPNMSIVMGGAVGLLGLFLFITMLTRTEIF
jgi:putative membrane protein